MLLVAIDNTSVNGGAARHVTQLRNFIHIFKMDFVTIVSFR